MGSKRKTRSAKGPKQSSVAATPVAQPDAAQNNDKSRRLKTTPYRSFRLQKRTKGAYSKLPSSIRLLRQAFGTLKRHWKLFLGIVVVNALLSVILVQGLSASTLNGSSTTSLSELLHGNFSQLASSASLFVYLLGSSGQSISPTASVYQILIGLIVSLALIWALRQVYAGHKVRIRDCFYQGMQPLVPFILVLLVIGLELLPLVAGATLYTMVTNNSIAATAVEQLLWGVLFCLLALLSLYMLTSSLFALYIVSLPGMTPVAALRSAQKLVAYRRWEVLRKIVFLPIALVLIAAAIIIPLIFLAAPLAAIVFFVLSTMLLAVVHSYLYALYREML